MKFCFLLKSLLLVSLSIFVSHAQETNPPSAVSSNALPQSNNPVTAEKKGSKIFIIPIQDQIDASMVYIVRRGVKEAVAAKADAILINMHTPGGEMQATEQIMSIMDKFEGATYTYVNSHAFSAGAFISASTKTIYMSPASVIGAAQPILMKEGGIEEAPEKFNSGYRSLLRAYAEKNGHNPDVFEAMVDKDKVLEVDGKTMKEKGKILTLTNIEAEKKYGEPPKRLVSAGTFATLDALLDHLGYLTPQVHHVEVTGAEKMARFIIGLAPLLLMLGLLGIYIEIKTPGFGFPGIAGILCLLIFFFGHYIAGLSGFEAVALFVLGVVLIAVEFFIFPGHIIPGLVGGLFLIISLLMAMVDYYPNGPVVPTMPDLVTPITNLGIAVSLTIIFALILARFLPHTNVYQNLVLQPAGDANPGTAAAPAADPLIGNEGITLCPLRPSGKAEIAEKVFDVVSEGDLIPANTRVRIIAVEGSRIVVRAV